MADDCLAVAAALVADDRLVAAALADGHAQRQAAQAVVAMRATWTAAGSHRAADDYRQAAVADDAAAADDSPSGHAPRTTGVRDSNGPSRSQSKT
ncbi:hypothetical protein PTKU46_15740 [Paraburkholderia terrae]